MKTGFRAVTFPAVIITCWAVTLASKTPNKGLPGNNKISIFSNKLTICSTSGWRAKSSHVISCHVMWITCLLVSSFWEGSSSLMEARDGSLESVSKTLSIRPRLFLECTVPLTYVHVHVASVIPRLFSIFASSFMHVCRDKTVACRIRQVASQTRDTIPIITIREENR